MLLGSALGMSEAAEQLLSSSTEMLTPEVHWVLYIHYLNVRGNK